MKKLCQKVNFQEAKKQEEKVQQFNAPGLVIKRKRKGKEQEQQPEKQKQFEVGTEKGSLKVKKARLNQEEHRVFIHSLDQAKETSIVSKSVADLLKETVFETVRFYADSGDV